MFEIDIEVDETEVAEELAMEADAWIAKMLA